MHIHEKLCLKKYNKKALEQFLKFIVLNRSKLHLFTCLKESQENLFLIKIKSKKKILNDHIIFFLYSQKIFASLVSKMLKVFLKTIIK